MCMCTWVVEHRPPPPLPHHPVFFLRHQFIAGVNVLVDPWLVGNLVFADSEWLYKGVKRVFKAGTDAAQQIASNTDLILLTMVRWGCCT